MKKILIVLNYYFPYVSGLSEYARIIAEEFCKKGYSVTVLTSNHANLKKEETINGVKVVRAPIICRISKGTISPAFILQAIRMARSADIVNLHLPMIESGVISMGIPARKLVVTYHCDINLPKNTLNNFIVKTMDWSNRLCLKKSRSIAVQTTDYARHSRVCRKYEDKFVEATAPIKDYHRVLTDKPETYPNKIIGFCGRLVEEKGIGILLEAYKLLCDIRQDVELVIGGDYQNVAGGSIYPSLKEYIKANALERVSFTGKIAEEKMEEFYSTLDVFVLPSINSLEAFGMVQVEAMYCGVPVVATNLYGVRTIVQNTKMGVIVEKSNPQALCEGILTILEAPQKYTKPKENISQLYSTRKCISAYEQAFEGHI